MRKDAIVVGLACLAGLLGPPPSCGTRKPPPSDDERLHQAFSAGIVCGALCEPDFTQQCMTTQCDYSWATKGDNP